MKVHRSGKLDHFRARKINFSFLKRSSLQDIMFSQTKLLTGLALGLE
jgi:hypothetical protein